LQKLLRARDVARDLTYELSSLIRPGMVEDEAHALYKELSKKHAVSKQWHPPKLRFGPNTTRSFKEPSQDYVLKENDIYFIDIGPVIDDHEADYGETFSLGNDFGNKHLADCAKKVFDETSQYWLQEKCNGPTLYQYAQGRARHYGYDLNSYSDGHRIGDFPHHVHFKGGLEECAEVVIPNAWILEIHLMNKTTGVGAFYEDILMEQN